MNFQKIKKNWFFTVFWGDLEGAGPRSQATSRSPALLGLKHLIWMKCNNDKNKSLYFSISGIFHIFKQLFFKILYQKLSLQSFKNLKAKMYSYEVSKSKISASEPQKMMVLCRFETMTLLMRHPVLHWKS